jgi:hypothetical protein
MSWAAAVAAVKVAAPYIAAGTGVVSAYSTIQAGKAQKSMYNLQAKQAQLKAQRDALQYEQQGNQVLERLLQNNASAAARGFAGGVSGFSGSAKLTQERSERVAGRDLQIVQEGARSAVSFGEIQSNMLRQAGDQAMQGAYFDAFAKIGEAAFMTAYTMPGGDGINVAKDAGISSFNPATNLDTFYKKGIYLNG